MNNTIGLSPKPGRKLSELLDRAQAGEPQHITRRGHRFVVSIGQDRGIESPTKLSFEEFLLSIPKFPEGEELDIPPRCSYPRDPFTFDDDL